MKLLDFVDTLPDDIQNVYKQIDKKYEYKLLLERLKKVKDMPDNYQIYIKLGYIAGQFDTTDERRK